MSTPRERVDRQPLLRPLQRLPQPRLLLGQSLARGVESLRVGQRRRPQLALPEPALQEGDVVAAVRARLAEQQHSVRRAARILGSDGEDDRARRRLPPQPGYSRGIAEG